MNVFIQIAKYSFLQYLMYPWEILAFLVKRALMLFFLAIFWSVVVDSSAQNFNFIQLISYFLIAQGMAGLTLAGGSKFGRTIQKLIKSGKLTINMIRPVKEIPYLFFQFIGEDFMEVAYSIVILVVGVFLSLPITLVDVFFFAVFWVFAFCIALAFNIILATVAFHFGEAGSIRNVYNHINTILNGSLIPISLFPGVFQKIVLLTPFPNSLYLPTTVLQNGVNWGTLNTDIALSAFWAIFLLVVSIGWWKSSLKKYDGVGL